MAYIPVGTYNDRDLSAEDKALVQAYQTMWQNAATDAERAAAHAGAEAIRSGYGYSGGGDGSDYILLQQEKEEPQREQPTYGGSGYDLSEYLRQQKAAQTEAELARLKGAYETSMRGYDDTAARLPQPYNTARNNLAAQNDIAQLNFDERAVAAGLSSGTAGQAMLSRQNAYVSGLAGIDQEQANAQAALDLQKANVTTEYETAIAEARNNGDAELASALYQELVRVQGLEREDEQLARSEAQRAQELALKYGLADPTGIAQIQSIGDLSAMRSGYAAGTNDLAATGTTTGNSIINNEGLTPEQVMKVQRALGSITVDGKSGDKTRAAVKAAGYTSLTDAYNKLFGGTGPTQVTTDYSSVAPRDVTKLDYSPDEGVFVWNNKRYGSTSQLLNDIEAAQLSGTQKQTLARAFNAYGFDISL